MFMYVRIYVCTYICMKTCISYLLQYIIVCCTTFCLVNSLILLTNCTTSSCSTLRTLEPGCRCWPWPTCSFRTPRWEACTTGAVMVLSWRSFASSCSSGCPTGTPCSAAPLLWGVCPGWTSWAYWCGPWWRSSPSGGQIRAGRRSHSLARQRRESELASRFTNVDTPRLQSDSIVSTIYLFVTDKFVKQSASYA